MRTNVMKRWLLFLLSIGMLTMVSCTKEETPDNQQEVREKLVGKWKLYSQNGARSLTNQLMVTTYEADGSEFTTVFLEGYHSLDWATKTKGSYTLNGDKLSVTVDQWTSISTLLSISDSVLTLAPSSAEAASANVQTVEFHKIRHDYGQAMLGLWEGTEFFGEETYGAADQRWEFFPNGTFIYYTHKGKEWVPDHTNTLNEYFVDGDYLAFRWVKNGKEYREWWNIAYCNSRMSWTALRTNDDGAQFTTTINMKRVE